MRCDQSWPVGSTAPGTAGLRSPCALSRTILPGRSPSHTPHPNITECPIQGVTRSLSLRVGLGPVSDGIKAAGPSGERRAAVALRLPCDEEHPAFVGPAHYDGVVAIKGQKLSESDLFAAVP